MLRREKKWLIEVKWCGSVKGYGCGLDLWDENRQSRDHSVYDYHGGYSSCVDFNRDGYEVRLCGVGGGVPCMI